MKCPCPAYLCSHSPMMSRLHRLASFVTTFNFPPYNERSYNPCPYPIVVFKFHAGAFMTENIKLQTSCRIESTLVISSGTINISRHFFPGSKLGAVGPAGGSPSSSIAFSSSISQFIGFRGNIPEVVSRCLPPGCFLTRHHIMF